MLNEDAGPDELESIAVAIHTLVGLPTTIRSLKKKGLRLEKGKIIDRDYTGPVLEEVLRTGRTVRGVPKEGTYLGRNVAVSTHILRGRKGYCSNRDCGFAICP